jgi:hypothetical protein
MVMYSYDTHVGTVSEIIGVRYTTTTSTVVQPVLKYTTTVNLLPVEYQVLPSNYR